MNSSFFKKIWLDLMTADDTFVPQKDPQSVLIPAESYKLNI
jgi:hypothetical protein